MIRQALKTICAVFGLAPVAHAIPYHVDLRPDLLCGGFYLNCVEGGGVYFDARRGVLPDARALLYPEIGLPIGFTYIAADRTVRSVIPDLVLLSKFSRYAEYLAVSPFGRQLFTIALNEALSRYQGEGPDLGTFSGAEGVGQAFLDPTGFVFPAQSRQTQNQAPTRQVFTPRFTTTPIVFAQASSGGSGQSGTSQTAGSGDTSGPGSSGSGASGAAGGNAEGSANGGNTGGTAGGGNTGGAAGGGNAGGGTGGGGASPGIDPVIPAVPLPFSAGLLLTALLLLPLRGLLKA